MLKATLARRVLLVPLAIRVPQVLKVLKVRKASLETTVPTVLRVPLGRKVPKVRKVLKVRKVPLVRKDLRAFRVLLVLKVIKASLVTIGDPSLFYKTTRP